MLRHSLFAALVFSSGTLCGLDEPEAHAQSPVPSPPVDSAAPSPAAPVTSSTDPFLDRINSARDLTAQQRYREALTLWQAAYELRQHPELLLEIARSQQRLGMAPEAIVSYRRFLTAHEHASDVTKREAESAIVRLTNLLPPSPVQLVTERAESPFRITTRPHHHGMLAAGWTLFSIGYAGAFGTGIAMGTIWSRSSGSYGSSTSSAAGWTLLIPVVGPFISGVVAPATAQSSTTYTLIWTLPWLLADLPFQVIGTALIIQGYRTPQRIVTPNILTRVMLRPYATPTGSGVSLAGAF